eukprot:TRINITY_DN1951_c0_g1_i1.p1 TRINITY_DN1951_c0_g1~~TRINITY_DN1951_c0_g1_i1.p1  ORF type:complete len:521 (+),score=124.01 TRINITY_DN1951_c0_g1_i1:28-1563(+)
MEVEVKHSKEEDRKQQQQQQQQVEEENKVVSALSQTSDTMSTESSSLKRKHVDETQQKEIALHKFDSLKPLFLRDGPFARPGFQKTSELLDFIGQVKILVIGAGGLGCELLKDLALSGFQNLHVIDLDTIDVSNLNRQFLFRKKDIGKGKAEVAATFIETRCSGTKVTPYRKKIQEFDTAFYEQFPFVIAGLDNVEARRYLNEVLCKLVKFKSNGDIDTDTVRPFIDGGTEGFSGQARVFLPMLSTCFQCSMQQIDDAGPHFHDCTIANVPRLPEHCIMYALRMQWPFLSDFTSPKKYTLVDKEKVDQAPNAVKLDKDNMEHMTWIYERALERANHYKINGVTFQLTMQVVKNIIPAIASTNALIAAACVTELLKMCTFCSMGLNNYYVFRGGEQTGIYSTSFEYKRNPHCEVCQMPKTIECDVERMTLKELRTKCEETFLLSDPSVTNFLTGAPLFNSGKILRASYEDNLSKTISELGVSQGSQLLLFDSKKRSVKIVLMKSSEEEKKKD